MLTLKKFLEVCVGVGELIGSCEFCIIFINIVSTLKSVFSCRNTIYYFTYSIDLW